ncbi:MAG: type II toxin-antitoxin system RelE family toxin [Candidatus Odinarchaeia archaeon]
MTYKVFLEKKVLKTIKNLPPEINKRIKEILIKLTNFPSDIHVKKLSGLHNKFRIRCGDYRILIELSEKTIIVFAILPRKKAYKR